jgi:hypothetical protein
VRDTNNSKLAGIAHSLLIISGNTKVRAQLYMIEKSMREENAMRKMILTLVGAALIAGSTTPAAFSGERHHVRNAQQFNSERFRNARAYAPPSYVPGSGSALSSEAGAWQTMTGFH